tara:strand:+ start:30 stop:530 length:501 start_codon:yes stop_codon:yes gene_type:complete
VKKLLLFFIVISLSGCSGKNEQNKEILMIDCPEVFFSSENNIYIDGSSNDTDLEGIGYKASINNYRFEKSCFTNQKRNNYNLDLLIIVKPINPNDQNISLPLFVLFYDLEGKLIARQYYRIKNDLDFDKESSKYEITDITESLNIYLEASQKVSYITVGFVNVNNN